MPSQLKKYAAGWYENQNSQDANRQKSASDAKEHPEKKEHAPRKMFDGCNTNGSGNTPQ